MSLFICKGQISDRTDAVHIYEDGHRGDQTRRRAVFDPSIRRTPNEHAGKDSNDYEKMRENQRRGISYGMVVIRGRVCAAQGWQARGPRYNSVTLVAYYIHPRVLNTVLEAL